MEEKKEKMADQEEEERKIPVFSVLKNGAILKNIFVINELESAAPETNGSCSGGGGQEAAAAVAEETLVVGRHPDCNIMLTHPSISRFHLQIHSVPSLQQLSVTDLSSVHGTWISDRKIEPGVHVELKEGDTIRIGGSTRIYRLHWIPLSRAYDVDNPFVSPVDVFVVKKEQEEVNAMLEAENVMEIHKDEEPVPDENEVPLLDMISEGVDALVACENSELRLKKEIPSEALFGNEPLCEEKGDMIRSSHLENDISDVAGATMETQGQQLNDDILTQDMKESVNLSLPEDELLPEIKPEQKVEPFFTLQPQFVTENEENSTADKKRSSLLDRDYVKCLEEENGMNPLESHEQSEPRSFVTAPLTAEESVNSSLPAGEVSSGVREKKEKQTPQSRVVLGIQSEKEDLQSSSLRSERRSSTLIWSKRGKAAPVLQIPTNRNEENTKRAQLQKQEGLSDKSISAPLNLDSENLEPEIFTPNKENLTPNNLVLRRLQEMGKIEENKSSSKVAQPPSSKIPLSHDIQSEEDIISASENLEPEIFTPNKENLTPYSHMLKRLQEVGKIEEKKSSSKAARRPFSSKVSFTLNIPSEDNIVAASEKENHTQGILREQKPEICSLRSQVRLEQEAVVSKRKPERFPFQPLLVNSPAKSRSSAGASLVTERSRTTEKTHPFSINSVEKSKSRWTIVVDISSLLDKESRKSLQLLQGLKETQLVIPRTVIRELDCLKQRWSLFRRNEEVTSVLEWIEECMVKSKWWIHVQSPVEESGPVAPTPPTSPQFLFNEGGTSCLTTPFPMAGNSMDIDSPTAEDHILECALLYRKKNSDGQLVLLSNNVTLKVKAMAEGVICEAAGEFYESLSNPFSERFLWLDSSPRGQTWSHFDDVVLRERYTNRYPSKKSSKGEPAKGLKLILLHNSHYGHVTSL